ncbi:MAG: hypothetical protein A2016_03470 [Elusimicrobia bacterium GWF2_62_30]|nr:MAG: hypothetical protein A2016_03470 [Elusimicrobia bacterium GWF2_62_30]
MAVANGQRLLLIAPDKPGRVQELPELSYRVIAGGVQFKGFLDKRRALLVHIDSVVFLVVKVAHRRPGRPDTVAEFLAQPSLYVLREIVHVILALPKSDGEHELSLRRGVEPEGRELELRDPAGIHQVDDAPAVHGVAGQPVRVPGHYAVGRALLKLSHHLVKDLAARLFGGLAFHEFAGNGQPLLIGVLAQLHQLRLYGQNLLVRLVGGFARVKKVPHIRLLHTLPPPLLRPVLPSRAEPDLSANSSTPRRG